MNLLREGIADNLITATQERKELTIANKKQLFVVYQIPLEYLYYNDKNDRIATWISQYKSDNGIKSISMENMEEYNSIIQDFIIKSNPESIKKTQSNIEMIGQQEVGVVLTDGRIIDGNRRFTCLRQIQKTRGPQYFKALILDRDITKNEKEIKLLELTLQLGKDAPVDYNPIDRLVGIYNDLIEGKLITPKEYADTIGVTENDIKKEMEKAQIMLDYLDFINAPKQFHIARNMNFDGPLNEMYQILKRTKNEEDKENLKSILFSNFVCHPVGDMTRYIREIGTIVKSRKAMDEEQHFLDEQLDFAEKVSDYFCEEKRVTENTINNLDNDLKEDLHSSTQKFHNIAINEEQKNKPMGLADKALSNLESIDLNLFQKMSEEQIDSFREKLNDIQDSLDKIRSAMEDDF